MVFVRDAAAPAGLRLRGWVALDSQNNRTRIDLSNQKFNVAVADSAFRWTDPRPKRRGRCSTSGLLSPTNGNRAAGWTPSLSLATGNRRYSRSEDRRVGKE